MSEPEQSGVDRSGAVCYSNRCKGEPTHRVQFPASDRWYGICDDCAEDWPVHYGTVLEGLTPETITTHPVATDGGSERETMPDSGVCATGYVCQNFPEHPGEEPEMVSAGPSPGVICPECGRMADGPDDEIPYGDPPHYGPDSAEENRSVDTGSDRDGGER